MAEFIHPHPGIASTARRVLTSLGLVAAIAFAASSTQAQTDFVEFESGQVRPLAMTPDGNTLLAVNTPDNTLEVFSIAGGSLTHTEKISVGMEPVAVAARSNTEVWVVNLLSDSVSIVDLSASPPRVVRTLLVGDEPRDIVFAGTGFNRAFISTAHRGQQRTDSSIAGVPGAGDPQLTTPGIGRADVWVFDATDLDNDNDPINNTTLGGVPVDVLTFFSDTPRALAVSPDGSLVYVAAFKSGNQTTTINETAVPDGFDGAGPSGSAPGGVPGPSDNALGDSAPETGVIVKFNGSSWVDALGRSWNGVVNFNLPDHDVFSFNADTLAPVKTFDHVGTILFNMVVHPDLQNPRVYVTNTELPNDRRFEGPGVYGGSTVQGHLSESRITVLDPAGPSLDVQHLNQHIDYNQLHTDPGADHTAINAQKTHSLATPLQPVISADGSKLYVAAFGSAKVGVFNVADIDDPNFESNFDPTVQSANYIDTGGGPSGLVLDEANNRLYVMTRFNNRVEVFDLTTKQMLKKHPLHNPESKTIRNGRRFLYDANLTSGNGETSCSSCHIFGDMDQLAWNLGNPDDVVTVNNQPSATAALPPATTFHPMKGPMTTQTLRGLATHGGMHWRGDRVTGFFGTDLCNQDPNLTAPCDEDQAFRNFIVAFEGLVGKEGPVTDPSFITPDQMQQFSDFALQIMLPPNPVRNLDNSLTSAAAAGESFYTSTIVDSVATCEGCHNLDPAKGFFGSGGEQSFEGEPQNAKVAHLRNLYNKVGMFGPSTGGTFMGDQIRGFGYLHDGSVDTVKHFLEAPVFSTNNTQELNLQAFMLQFPSDLAPIVGQQVTLDATNAAVANPRIDLMIQRASTTNFKSLVLGNPGVECEVIVKGIIASEQRGAVRLANGQFRTDKAADPTATDAQIRALASTDGPLTYTCVPPGSGERMGINLDRDNFLDGDDNCPGSVNNNQADDDNDGIGNACDPDFVPTGC